MESFTLENMIVDRVVLCGADWIAFLGHRNVKSAEATDKINELIQEERESH